jgi:predicted Rossmann fold nucleotide-binding protein DprA/Smf involved in DNA uptake
MREKIYPSNGRPKKWPEITREINDSPFLIFILGISRNESERKRNREKKKSE